MIEKNVYFKDEYGNRYLYSYELKYFFFLPPSNNTSQCENSECADKEIQWYSDKTAFLNSLQLNEEVMEMQFTTRPNPELIKKKLANLRQLLFEVTDGCNLNCKYCGYGELYGNYDQRDSQKLSLDKVKIAVDYLVDLWKSPLNTSYDNTVDVGFYGGEPLVNMALIKKIVSYLKSKVLDTLRFNFRMTTNAVLLDRYMEYLVENEFNLLISLDGDEYNNSYRVTTNGKNSFNTVYRNICTLREKYPDYYDKKVNFNAVLHNRNSVADIYGFIKKGLGKTPRIAALSSNYIQEDKRDEFDRMYNDNYLSMQQAYLDYNNEDGIQEVDPELNVVNSIINSYSGNTFASFSDLLRKKEEKSYLPTGTCFAFHKKIFITVNGKILPCEKVGQSIPLGKVMDNEVQIDFETISNIYDTLYTSVVNLCKHCYQQTNCSYCIFQIVDPTSDKKHGCYGFMNKKSIEKYFGRIISYLQKNPKAYEDALKQTYID